MSTHTASVDVDRPIDVVYNQWTQFESFPQFMEGVERIDQRDDTHTHWVIKVGGVTREFDATITEQHPEERVAWKSDSGPDHAGVVTFHRLADDKTRVTTQMDVDPEGFVENVADKLGVVKARVKGDLDRFKEFIERQSSETGAWRGDVSRPDQ
ncbi:SRPBCC family protein [Mycolicibacterium grossiae]|uniref:Cyclase n=1 Tax=Mycolicibacterium grossiae TaxID=1552759 RepID=A0A1E8Q3U8_9MYCO|nr:SRPBCC family protein [Mycolicibacterium grossiae]OFJ53116.1 cyclase [Mycolicibacterium grossiae]QEM44777.1 SRPBCC family protein [Mycolicibacterium grossiae]